MAAFTTAALIGGAVLGAGTMAYGAVQQRNARKDAMKSIREQEEQARIEAANAAAVRDLDTTTADVSLGRGKAGVAAGTGTAGSAGGAAAQSGAVGARVGGLRKRRVSAGLGL